MTRQADRSAIDYHNSRARRPPSDSGTHRLWFSTGAREVPTMFRAGLWAGHVTCSTWHVTHLPTGLRLGAVMQWLACEAMVLALSEHCPSWGALLGWGDKSGAEEARQADPEPGTIAGYFAHHDAWFDAESDFRPPFHSARPWAEWLAGPGFEHLSMAAVEARVKAGEDPAVIMADAMARLERPWWKTPEIVRRGER